MRGDFAAPERRIRKPVKGLRQRLRVALRAAGVTAKFRTDHGRKFMGYGKDFLIVIAKVNIRLPFQSFDGRPVVLMIR